MITVKFTEDGSNCHTIDYQSNPDKYRGRILCLECGEKAWFIKGYTTPKMERMACFGAHHKENCTASTVQLISDDDSEQGKDENINLSDILVDLDRSSSQSIYISVDNDKHKNISSDWKSSPTKNAIGNASGYPLNKSLRQLLSNLCRNTMFAEKDQDIKIITNSGRVLIDGKLKDNIVHLSDVSADHLGKIIVYWGAINNLSENKGSLWLNYGNYHTEPSIILSNQLKNELVKNFKLTDVAELDGSDVIIVGRAGITSNGKVIIKTGFTKYMSFRRHHVINK